MAHSKPIPGLARGLAKAPDKDKIKNKKIKYNNNSNLVVVCPFLLCIQTCQFFFEISNAVLKGWEKLFVCFRNE